MSDFKDMATRIRTARAVLGITQAELADAVGVTRSAVAQWETGRSGQVGGTLTKLAEVLGVTPSYLLIGSADDRAAALSGDELALLRLYRACPPTDRAYLLRTAKLISRGK